MLAPGGSWSHGEGKAEMQTRAWLGEAVPWLLGPPKPPQAACGAPGNRAHGLADAAGEWRSSSAQCTFILLNTRLVLVCCCSQQCVVYF